MTLPVVSLATGEDNAELRRLAREICMPGSISVAFEREPDFFAAARIEGEQAQIIAARMGARVVGTVCYSRRRLFVNGAEAPVGYLSMARLEPGWRGRGVKTATFDLLRQLVEADAPAHCIASFAADNPYRRAFIGIDGERLPRFEPRERICTLLLPSRAPGRRPPLPAVRDATGDDLPAIVDCLRRHAVRRQFSVAWDRAALEDEGLTRGLDVGDFSVVEARGRVLACVALWDQSRYKQTVIKRYSGALRLLRPALNALAPLARLPRLPAPEDMFQHAFLSHLAVDGDDPELTLAVLRHARDKAQRRGLPNLSLGLSERDARWPRLARAFGGVKYWTLLCTVGWPGSTRPPAPLDARPIHPEIATL